MFVLYSYFMWVDPLFPSCTLTLRQCQNFLMNLVPRGFTCCQCERVVRICTGFTDTSTRKFPYEFILCYDFVEIGTESDDKYAPSIMRTNAHLHTLMQRQPINIYHLNLFDETFFSRLFSIFISGAVIIAVLPSHSFDSRIKWATTHRDRERESEIERANL